MPKFETGYEQQKWSKLERQARVTLDKLRSGMGTAADLKKAEVLIAQYGGLATDVMGKAVQLMRLMGKERIDRIDSRRMARGKSPLQPGSRESLLELAITRVVQSEGAELAITLEDSMKSLLEQQDERQASMFQRKLDELRGDLPSTDDTIALQEASDEDQANDLDNQVQRIIDYFDGKFADTFSKIDKAVEDSMMNGLTRFIEKIRGEGPTAAGTPLLEGALSSSYSVSTMAARTGEMGGIGAVGTPVQVSEQFEQELGNTITKQGDLLDTLNTGITDLDEPPSKKDEQEKADTWWRRLKVWMGDNVGSKAKKAGLGIFAGLLALAGRALLTQLFGGRVLNDFQSMFSIDKIKEYGDKLYDYVAEKSKSLLSWISAKFDKYLNPLHEDDADIARKSASAAQTASTGKTYAQSQLNMFKEKLEQAKAEGNPSAIRFYTNKVAAAQKNLDIHTRVEVEQTKQAEEAAARAGIDVPPTKPVTEVLPTVPDTTNQPSTPNISDKAAFGVFRRRRGNTTPEAIGVDVSPAVTLPIDGGMSTIDQPQMSKAVGGASFNLGSFGYNSSVDQMLGIVNLDLIGS